MKRKKWSCTDDGATLGVSLHTCHTHVGYGTLISKETAAKFIELIELDPIDVRYSDMYFMTYSNQSPYQLEGTALDEGATIETEINTDLEPPQRQHVVSRR